MSDCCTEKTEQRVVTQIQEHLSDNADTGDNTCLKDTLSIKSICPEYKINPELTKWAETSMFPTLPKMLKNSVATYGERPYLGVRNGNQYEFETYNQFYAKVLNFASALIELGIEPTDRVANFTNNRPQWPLIDFGIVFAGCIHVPMYATLSGPEMAFIVKDCGARVVVTASEEHLQKVLDIADQCPNLEHIVAITLPSQYHKVSQRVWSFADFLQFGKVHLDKNSAAINYITEQIKPEDIASLVYTSGTTGLPKGAMLMHGNFCSQATLLTPQIQATCEDVQMSFLPLAHVFERVVYYIMTSVGASIGYTAGLHTLVQDLSILRPTIMPSVPILFSKLYDRHMEKISGLKTKPYRWALKVGRSFRVAQRAGKVSQVLKAKQLMSRKMMFNEIHKRSGGRIRYFISGGAPLRKEIAEFFADIGFTLLEGYGLTETSPVLTLNPSFGPHFGTVGVPVAGTSLKIDSDGEILAKGPNIMRGYYKRYEDTLHAIDQDGWFHTGDIGHIDSEGFLTITDRKKGVLVLSNGKNVAPSPIEQLITSSPWIDRAVLVGHNRPFVCALVVPNFEKLTQWAVSEKLPEDIDSLVGSEKAKSLIMAEIRDACKDLSNYEKIKKVYLMGRDFSVAAGELTHSMKVKRAIVEEKFAEEIDSLYE